MGDAVKHIWMQDVACSHRYQSERDTGKFKRNRILRYIQKHPGAHENMIKRELNLANGSAGYNLERLVTEGLLERVKKTNKTRFYIKGCVDETLETQDKVQIAIQNGHDKNQKQLAKDAEITAATFCYHADRLVKEGKIKKLENGKEVRYVLINSPSTYHF